MGGREGDWEGGMRDCGEARRKRETEVGREGGDWEGGMRRSGEKESEVEGGR